MALAAESPADRVEQLIALTDRLMRAAIVQIEALEVRAVPEQPGDDIQRLAHAYRMEMLRIKDDPSLVAGAPPERLILLKDATARFDQILARQNAALSAMKEIAEGLARAMAEEASNARRAPIGYGPGAQAGPAPNVPLTVNAKA